MGFPKKQSDEFGAETWTSPGDSGSVSGPSNCWSVFASQGEAVRMVAGVSGAILLRFCALPATVTGDAGLRSGRVAVSSQRRFTTESGVCEDSAGVRSCVRFGLCPATDCERAGRVFGTFAFLGGGPGRILGPGIGIFTAAFVDENRRALESSLFSDTMFDDGP
jgi:hypothetical protein